jgi:acetyl-CoA carboxylase biotin carboxyl carrier protein
MDHRELKRLVQLMNENGLVELEIEQEGSRISLRKGTAPAPGSAHAPIQAVFAPPAPPAALPPSAAPAAAPSPPAAPSGPPPGTKDLLSPMVGTFYRRSSPDADPYVQVGDKVTKDSVVCIVEAMKLNNEIKAEMNGEIVEILAEDGEPVEFDQPLFRLKVA